MSTAQDKDRQVGAVPENSPHYENTKLKSLQSDYPEASKHSETLDVSSSPKQVNCLVRNTNEPLDTDVICGENADETPKLNGGENTLLKDEDIELTNAGDKLHCEDQVAVDTKLESLILTAEQLASISKDDLVEKWIQQEHVVACMTQKLASIQPENLSSLQSSEEKLKAQVSELQKKEQYHIMRLATKEHEIQEMGNQIDELKSITTGGSTLKHSLLDPAVNLLFERMKRDLDITKTKMEETQNELAAWKFTPDSNTGKQLMAKCRLLIKENEELGKMITSGRLAKLEGDLSMQRNFSEEVKKSQSELDEFLQEMDEDTEGMQGTIMFLQSELREAKERIAQLTSHQSNGATHSDNTSDNGPVADKETTDSPLHSNGSGVPNVSDTQSPLTGLKRTLSETDEPSEVDENVCKKARTTTPEVVENGV